MREEIIKALNWRYAVKDFDTTKKMSEQDLLTILESARLAPSVNGIEAWKFIVVENPDVRAALRTAGFGQSKFTDSSHLVIVARRTDVMEHIIDERIERTARIQGVSQESLGSLRQSLVSGIGRKAKDQKILDGWITAQTYIALGMMIETAALLDVDAGPMEGFVNSEVDDILGLPAKHLASVSAIAFGYRLDSDIYSKMPKVRRDFDEVVEFVR